MEKGKAGKRPKIVDAGDGVKLTIREFDFCNNYLRHYNPRRAAEEAGYSMKTVNPTAVASAIMNRGHVRKYISTQLRFALTKEKTSAIMDDFLTSDLGEIYSKSGDSYDMKAMYEAGVSHLIKKHKVKRTTRSDGEGQSIVVEEYEVEREDKIRAAEVLAKLEGWITSDTNVNINVISAAQKVRDKVKELRERGILKNK